MLSTFTFRAWCAEPSPAAAFTDQSPQEMAQEIQQLRAKLNDLEARQQKLARQQEEKQTIAGVEADARDRSTFGIANGGLSAGYKDNRFFIGTADGNFLFRPWLHLQVRNSTTWREGGTSVPSDDTQNGFELRRARFGFDGNLFSKDFQYFFNWATYRGNSSANVTDASGNKIGTVQQLNGGTPVLEEAWVLYRFHDTSWAIRAGQMHDPLAHEAIVGSKYRAPEASLQTDIFANTDTFTQAATVIYDPKDSFRFEGGVTDGARAANTNFQDFPNNGTQYNWGVAGRAEYKIFGDWKDYNQLTNWGNKQDLLVFGAGVDNSQRGSSNSLSHTFDVQYGQASGLFLYGAYFGRFTSNNPGIFSGAPVSTNVGTSGNPGADTYEYSFLAQAGYMIDQRWEPFLRYEYLWLQGTPAGSNNAVHDISVGLNYYFHGHNAKLTTQLMYLPNGIPVNDDSSDVLINNDKQELVFMTQFQLLL